MVNEGEELRAWMKENDLNANKLAGILNIERQTIYYHLKQENIASEFKKRLSDKGYNIPKLKVKSNGKLVVNEGTPVYDIAATATQAEMVNQVPEVPNFYVNVPGYEDCNFGLYVHGHSMYPTIENGSLILCRRLTDKSVIMYGEIYLIRTADYLMVKRLQKNEDVKHVLCTSDNFEKRSENYRRYEPFELEKDKIIDLYIVKGIIKKTQS